MHKAFRWQRKLFCDREDQRKFMTPPHIYEPLMHPFFMRCIFWWLLLKNFFFDSAILEVEKGLWTFLALLSCLESIKTSKKLPIQRKSLSRPRPYQLPSKWQTVPISIAMIVSFCWRECRTTVWIRFQPSCLSQKASVALNALAFACVYFGDHIMTAYIMYYATYRSILCSFSLSSLLLFHVSWDRKKLARHFLYAGDCDFLLAAKHT